jgi:hypothetical protein
MNKNTDSMGRPANIDEFGNNLDYIPGQVFSTPLNKNTCFTQSAQAAGYANAVIGPSLVHAETAYGKTVTLSFAIKCF